MTAVDLTALAKATRNPVLALKACRRIQELDPHTREVVAAIFRDAAAECNELAELNWRRRKAPMACYYRIWCTYFKHFSRAVRRPEIPAPTPLFTEAAE